MKKILSLIIFFLFFPSVLMNLTGYGLKDIDSQDDTSTLTKPCRSWVEIIDGIPRLVVNGKPLPITGYYGCVEVYYDDPDTENDEAEEHLDKYIRHINYAAEGKLNIINLNIVWGGLDQNLNPPSSPEDAAARLDWSRIDFIMDYAASKGVYVMILFRWRPFYWWYQMNDRENYYYCTQRNNTAFIEDDGVINGSVLMPSFAASNLLRYADEVVKSMINRYKKHPALLGWKLALGWTTENNYPGGGYYNAHGWFDYSPYMKEQFRVWLRDKYKTLDALRTAWNNSTVTFDNVEPPQPPKPDKDLDNDVLNGPGDIRRSWLDWQLFRLEMKKRERDHFAVLYKRYDPDHVVVAIPGTPLPGGRIIDGANELIVDYYDYVENPNIDGIVVCPHIDKYESLIQIGGGLYNLIKYFHSHGKFVFIKLEKWKDLVPPNSIESMIYFFTAMGAGILWDMGGIPAFGEELLPPGYPEFSSEYTEKERKIINRSWYLIQRFSRFEPRKEKFAFIDPASLCIVDNQETGYYEGRYHFSCYKGLDRIAAAAMFGFADLEFDVIPAREVVTNPEILNNYKAIALVNIFRMNESLLDTLINYRNEGGGLFIVGRTGIFDEFGNRNLTILQRLLGISTQIKEYKVNMSRAQDRTWMFALADDALLNSIEGKTVDNHSFYYIPVFDYTGYKVIGHLSDKPEIAVVGYKDKTVFWFSRLGWDVGYRVLYTEEQFDAICKFLRNLYDFYGINRDEVEDFEVESLGGWYRFLYAKEGYQGYISFDLTCLEDFDPSSEYIIYDWGNMKGIVKTIPVNCKITTGVKLEAKKPYLFSIMECSFKPSFIAAEWAVLEEEEWNGDELVIYLETKPNREGKVAVYLSNRENYTVSLNGGSILNIVRDNRTDTLLIEFRPEENKMVLKISFEGMDDNVPPSIYIERPGRYLYIFDREIASIPLTMIIGKITVKVRAVDNQSGIRKVEFYVDDSLKFRDYEPPYRWLWDEPVIGRYEIKVVAYDNRGNKEVDKIDVIIFNL